MEKIIIYESESGNEVALATDGFNDYEVLINDMPVVNTGDRAEGEVIAESIDIAINLLYIQNRLRKKERGGDS